MRGAIRARNFHSPIRNQRSLLSGRGAGNAPGYLRDATAHGHSQWLHEGSATPKSLIPQPTFQLMTQEKLQIPPSFRTLASTPCAFNLSSGELPLLYQADVREIVSKFEAGPHR